MADSTGASRSRDDYMPKTIAKELFCLSERELEALEHKEKTNPYRRKGPPMKLFLKDQLETLAAAKFGSLEALEAERSARLAKKAMREQERAAAAAVVSEATAAAVSETGNAEGSTEVGAVPDAAPEAMAAPPGTADDGRPRPALAPVGGPAAGTSRLVPNSRGVVPPWPPFLAERVRDARNKKPARLSMQGGGTAGGGRGGHVLYWMRTALRGHENPALDAARHEAAARGTALAIATFVLADHPFPTARRVKFLMEGLADLQAELRAQGAELGVFVEGHTRDGDGVVVDGWVALRRAAGTAALVVTEEMPTSPYADWVVRLAAELPTGVALWTVDTACTYPMFLTRAAPRAAYAFRSSVAQPRKEIHVRHLTPSLLPQAKLLKRLYQLRRSAPMQRLAQLPYRDHHSTWSFPPPGATAAVADASGPESDGLGPAALPARLGWRGEQLAGAPQESIASLVAGCAWVDHSVPGVEHMIGGCGEGYRRWEHFKAHGLQQYAARRNSAMLRDGVSRLSAYHHYGMVSPWKIARDALGHKSSGATKFADEFLTWRELAYAFCLHRWPALESYQALPDWSATTLRAHAGDAREIKSLPELERGETGDVVWDALQHQLNVTGELHNNVRMTWGKALLPWCADPEAALRVTCHLNHKFALDGCDPCSYAGILWCFGQFDGPKGAEATPVFGRLRQKPTSWLARKLDAAAYRGLVVVPFGAPGAPLASPAKRAQPGIQAFFKPLKK